jgi:hypothetical protein
LKGIVNDLEKLTLIDPAAPFNHPPQNPPLPP